MKIHYWAIPGIRPADRLPINRTEQAQHIIDAVAEYFCIGMFRMKQPTRKKEVVRARQTVMYLLVKHTKLTKKVIGEMFNRDHTTVIHSCAAVKDHMDCEPEVLFEINKIEQQLFI